VAGVVQRLPLGQLQAALAGIERSYGEYVAARHTHSLQSDLAALRRELVDVQLGDEMMRNVPQARARRGARARARAQRGGAQRSAAARRGPACDRHTAPSQPLARACARARRCLGRLARAHPP